MSLKRMTTAIAATATAILIGTSAAAAAQATASVNVRSGPGTNFRVVDVLSPGETVRVGECRSNGFCYISHSGPGGWVSSRYLAEDRQVRSDRPRVSPNVTFSFSFGRGDGFSFDAGRSRSQGELVCLVTFFERSQVAGGADANVQRAQLLPRREAERRDGPNDRRAVFDYGTNQQNRETCRYLDRLN
ncbi:MAG: serine-type D-Ala-D-Ala carboxypeptidase [Devosia sp.]|jgi:uncharacterized protein YgiM (DUF1202 family)|nr:serine-type D-Ala-D-Ala carboxypeptidase [Devosia sp.]